MFQPQFRITSYLLNLIAEASALRQWIERERLQVEWIPMLQREARSRSAHSSTEIEGNPLTLPQVRALERGENIGVPKIYEREVTNYIEALRWIERHTRHQINEKNILFLHKILMDGLLPENKCGRYKEHQNYIVDEKDIKVFTPPSPKETPRLVQNLIAWMQSPEVRELHAIITSAIFHHRFVSIHPFPDGNGRLSRLIETWILYQSEFDSQHIFNLDEFFAHDRGRYYDMIEQVRELDGNLTHWLEYVAEGIVFTLKQIKKRIVDLQVAPKSKIFLTPRQEEILHILKDKSPTTVARFQKALGVTRSRLQQLLHPMVESGLVVREGVGRSTRYLLAQLNEEYLAELEDIESAKVRLHNPKEKKLTERALRKKLGL